MSTIANLTVADNVPANHVFYPIQSGPRSLWITHEAANALTQASFLVDTSLATPARATDKVKMNLAWPFAQTVDGAVFARSIARRFSDWVLPADMTTAERLLFVAISMNIEASALVKAILTDRDIPM